MPGRTSDDSRCPVCGQAYDQRIVVERGDQWGDLFAGSPLDFFGRYRRRCSARADVERDVQLGDDQCAVYFHGRVQRRTVF